MSGKYLSKILDRIDDLDRRQLIGLVQRLLKERTLFESIFDAIREGILVIDANGSLEYLNRAAQQFLGLSKQSLYQNLWKLVPDLGKILQQGEYKDTTSFFSCEFEVSYPDALLMRLHAIPLQNGSKDQRSLLMLTDITQDKAFAERKIAQERLSSVFSLAAEVAHEIGNPLNSIQIHLALIQRQFKHLEASRFTDKAQQSLSICTNEIRRLDELIKHFLQAIRPKSLVLKKMNILEPLEKTLKLLEHQLNDLQIAVNLQINTTLPLISLDEDQIQQVFFNVLKNAMEAMSQGGVITIQAHLVEDQLLLRFMDQGKGISGEWISQLFQAYETTKQTGHGIGMMIIQRIMHAHGGSVDLETRPDKGMHGEAQRFPGTTVTLRFPLQYKRFKTIEQPSVLPELTQGEFSNG